MLQSGELDVGTFCYFLYILVSPRVNDILNSLKSEVLNLPFCCPSGVKMKNEGCNDIELVQAFHSPVGSPLLKVF